MDQMNKLIEQLSKRLHTTPEQLQKSADNGQIDQILNQADSDSAARVRAVLSDPEKTKALLNSPQAQALMKRLNAKEK